MSMTPGMPPVTAPPYDAPPPARRVGMAVAALVFGIVGLVLCPIFGVVGIILGIIAVVRAADEPAVYGGKGMGIAGICTGGASLLLLPLLISILLPSLARARELAMRAVDQSNLRGVGQACQIYANDNEKWFPPNLSVLIEAGWITQGVLQNPADGDMTNQCDYYFVSGLREEDPSRWIAAYSDPAYHNGEGANVLYLDGHVEFIKEPRFTKQLEKFREAFAESRGYPPEIIEPE